MAISEENVPSSVEVGGQKRARVLGIQPSPRRRAVICCFLRGEEDSLGRLIDASNSQSHWHTGGAIFIL
jgi:hypothetical protein